MGTMTREGARNLARTIAEYWAKQADDFEPPIVAIETTGGVKGRHEVRSNMVDGQPKRRQSSVSSP